MAISDYNLRMMKPYALGAMAFSKMLQPRDNPYKEKRNYGQWLRGWTNARTDYCDSCIIGKKTADEEMEIKLWKTV